MQNMMAARLLVILTHPAFRVLTQVAEGTYRLEMTEPLEEAWQATGTVRWIIESSYELPLEG